MSDFLLDFNTKKTFLIYKINEFFYILLWWITNPKKIWSVTQLTPTLSFAPMQIHCSFFTNERGIHHIHCILHRSITYRWGQWRWLLLLIWRGYSYFKQKYMPLLSFLGFVFSTTPPHTYSFYSRRQSKRHVYYWLFSTIPLSWPGEIEQIFPNPSAPKVVGHSLGNLVFLTQNIDIIGKYWHHLMTRQEKELNICWWNKILFQGCKIPGCKLQNPMVQ